MGWQCFVVLCSWYVVQWCLIDFVVGVGVVQQWFVIIGDEVVVCVVVFYDLIWCEVIFKEYVYGNWVISIDYQVGGVYV